MGWGDFWGINGGWAGGWTRRGKKRPVRAFLVKFFYKRVDGRPIRKEHLSALIGGDGCDHGAVDGIGFDTSDAGTGKRKREARPEPDRQVGIHRRLGGRDDVRQAQPDGGVNHFAGEGADEKVGLVDAKEIVAIGTAAHEGHGLRAVQAVAARGVTGHGLGDCDGDAADAIDQGGELIEVEAQIITQGEGEIVRDGAHGMRGTAAGQGGFGEEMGGVDAVLSELRDGDPQIAGDGEELNRGQEGIDGEDLDGVTAPSLAGIRGAVDAEEHKAGGERGKQVGEQDESEEKKGRATAASRAFAGRREGLDLLGGGQSG